MQNIAGGSYWAENSISSLFTISHAVTLTKSRILHTNSTKPSLSMKNIFLGLVLIMLNFSLNAQFEDNFDDNSFPNDPDWFGNTDIYIVNAQNELQLMDIDAGESSVYTLAPTADSTVWEFFFRLEFAPSASNFLRVYLNSNNPDFDGELQGYYLQIGQSGSDDSIELRRQDGTGSTIILSGTTGAVATDPAVRVRVSRDATANWQLWADYTGGTDFQLEGNVVDATYNGGSYFGFKCVYGVTRRDKFFFDDIIIGPIVEDQEAPELLHVEALDMNTVSVQFNEPLETASAELITNYTLDNGIVVNGASLDTDPSRVLLDVSDLSSGISYILSVQGVSDLNNNTLSETQFGFTYFLLEQAVAFDILINELFPEPDPAITSLPDAEYIELFNRSDKAINLEDFEIFDASNTRLLPAYVLPPQSYLIICDAANVVDYLSFGAVLGVSGLFSLNDGGDIVGIRNNEAILIHEVSYDTDTYQDEEKDNGGWSIELINPNLYCRGISNWRASNANEGGTPGTENSIFENSIDDSAPVLLEVVAISQNELLLLFNEEMGIGTIINTAYTIQGTGGISDAVLEDDLRTVRLTLNAPFLVDQQTYTLEMNELISDCSGNVIGNFVFDFTFFQAQPAERYDILINEFYPDFSPSFGLPEQEFIELYNRSDKTINLEGFQLFKSSESVELPFYLLRPDSYVILYEAGNTNNFGVFGDTLALDNFIGLGNEADEFALLDTSGALIHSVDYDQSFYQDADKTEGGWTIELINPNAPCLFSSNWRASNAALGGTPGTVNSVLDNTIDDSPLDLINAFPVASNEVRLFFNKALDQMSAEDIANYTVEGLTITSASEIAPYNIIALSFSENLEAGVIYEVVISSGLEDCSGNGAGLFDRARFAIPETIEEKDIIINEVLYDPLSGGSRFVELYNRSDKVLNISDLHIADRDDEGQDIDSNFEIITDFLMFPGDYIVLSASPQNIIDNYFVENIYAMIVSSVPAYKNGGDAVVIFVPDVLGPRIIDEFAYTDDFHNPLLDDEEGVSLERISFEGASEDINNWQSAAEVAGFATPTYLNSQFMETGEGGDNIFDIPNPRFSPDNDGFEDFLQINYQTEQSGWVANINCYDANGRLVKELVNNQSLAVEGTFKWEGDTDNGSKARIGIYVIWIELFKADGEVEYFKKTAVLAGQLD